MIIINQTDYANLKRCVLRHVEKKTMLGASGGGGPSKGGGGGWNSEADGRPESPAGYVGRVTAYGWPMVLYGC